MRSSPLPWVVGPHYLDSFSVHLRTQRIESDCFVLLKVTEFDGPIRDKFVL